MQLNQGVSPASGQSLPSEILERSDRLRSRLLFAHGLSQRIAGIVPGRLGVKLGSFAARSILPKFREPIFTPTLMGFDLLVGPGDGQAYYYEGCYEAGTLDVLHRCLSPGDVFVDAGASVGQMTLCAAQIVGESGRVFSFEPAPSRMASLETAVSRAGLANVVTKQMALGADAGQLELYMDLVSPSLVGRELDTAAERRTVSVEVRRLDDVLAEEHCTEVRMMKIDVEGFELQLLQGASGLLESAGAPIICIEHERHGGDEMRPLHFLQSLNDYAFFNLAGRKSRASKLRRLSDPSQARVGDNVFCLLPNHIAECEKMGLIEA